MKAPRVIPISRHLHPVIHRMFEKAKWPEDRVGEIGAKMLRSIEKAAEDMQNNLWDVLGSVMPEEMKGLASDRIVFDYELMTVNELDESGNKTGQTFNIPEYAALEVKSIVQEIATTRNSAKLVGVACMGITEEAGRAMRDMYSLVQKEYPECTVGNWQLDIKNMTMAEVLERPDGTPSESNPDDLEKAQSDTNVTV